MIFQIHQENRHLQSQAFKWHFRAKITKIIYRVDFRTLHQNLGVAYDYPFREFNSMEI